MTDLRDMLGYPFKRSDGRREEAKRKQDKVVLELICQGYEEFMQQANRDIPTEITDRYNPTKEQVLAFSRALVRYKDLKDFASDTSNYLTALMHSSKDTEFEIDLTELNEAGLTLNYLGYKLQGKKITVNGNAGNRVGNYAQNSQITINGNAGKNVGFIAENSQITVNGDAGDGVGQDAKDSQICIKGTYKSLSDIIGAGTEIYKMQNGIWVRVHPK
jgi:hypothetical protein